MGLAVLCVVYLFVVIGNQVLYPDCCWLSEKFGFAVVF